MMESKMVVCTSKDPGGGAGISRQMFVMYRSIGSVISPIFDNLFSCVKYSRKAMRYGYVDNRTTHLGKKTSYSEVPSLFIPPLSPEFLPLFSRAVICVGSHKVKQVPYIFFPVPPVATK